MSITDKMGKNGQLSVKIQTFLIRFYGQMLQKWHFVCKFEWNLGLITDKHSPIRNPVSTY